MLFIYKNKGMLIPVYLFVSVVGTALLIETAHMFFYGEGTGSGNYVSLGIGLLVAALWTYLTKDEYYKDKDGRKVKMDVVNEFFFINMKFWAYIFVALAVVCFILAMLR